MSYTQGVYLLEFCGNIFFLRAKDFRENQLLLGNGCVALVSRKVIKTLCKISLDGTEKEAYAKKIFLFCLFELLLCVNSKQLVSCRDSQLSYLHCSWANIQEAVYQYFAFILRC